jgi:hypothetical protein
MNDLTVQITAVTHQTYAALRRLQPESQRTVERDRGAVSLEQVLWFVAAGVSVAVIAAILWGQIKDTAETPIDNPTAP